MFETLIFIFMLPLMPIAFLCVIQMPAVIVGRFERRSVWPYADIANNSPALPASTPTNNPYAPPATSSAEPIPVNKYAANQLAQASRHGFKHLASTADLNKKFVRVQYEFLVSTDQKTLAIVSFGTIASIPVQTVFMMSQLRSGVFFTTLGSHEACCHDLNQERTEMLVLNADFETMLQFHQQRSSVLGAEIKPLVEGKEIQALYQYRVQRYRDYEFRGLIRYLGNDDKEWKYTWKGAFLFVYVATIRQLRRIVYPDRFLTEPMLGRINKGPVQ